MIASMNRSKLNLNTPADTTNNLNGNGGGSNVATSTANASYFSIQFFTRACFASENLFSARAPARREIKYKIQQPIADPLVAINAYNNIQLGFVVDKSSINASALLGRGTNVESSNATANSPKAPYVTKYSERRVSHLMG